MNDSLAATFSKCDRLIAGVDEAGRGSWAGPVVAAAVVLHAQHTPPGLNDSKKLNRTQREELYALLGSSALIATGCASVEEIDSFNILQATLLAMQRAIHSLPVTVSSALVDGLHAPDVSCPVTTVVAGDAQCPIISAASIIAKVSRDRTMQELARSHPGYGWERNNGYGTAEHRAAIERLGITRHHRRSFRPVARFLRT